MCQECYNCNCSKKQKRKEEMRKICNNCSNNDQVCDVGGKQQNKTNKSQKEFVKKKKTVISIEEACDIADS